MTSKRFLVTGGGGFIGSALVKRLVQKGHRVRVLDDFSRGVKANLTDVVDKIELVQGDVCKADSVAPAVKGIDSVLHLAAVNGTEFFYKKPQLVLDVAVRGMLNVLDACLKEGVSELVLASSSEVYQTPPRVPTDETVPLVVPDVLNPRYSYGGGKIVSELLAVNYGRAHFKRVLIFRPHNVYGPSMGWEHVLPQLTLRAFEAVKKTSVGAVPFPMQGDGSQIRAFVHIDDFIDGVMVMLEHGKHLNIYNIGNPEEVTIKDVAKLIFQHFNREFTILPEALPEGGCLRRCPDISKLAALGYKPKISLREGLPPVLRWYAEHFPQHSQFEGAASRK